MLISLKWLKEFVDFDLSPERIADLLTMGGIEVEGIKPVGQGLEGILTARIVHIEKHPHADKLSLADIELGQKTLRVVCGAPNIAVGQMVPYAGPGEVLPSGMEIVEREIKGVSSPGMLCSEKELGLGEDASGILVFDADVTSGVPLPQAFPYIEDFILETSVTPNRGDCLSILGTAREVAALLGVPWRIPEFDLQESSVPIATKAVIEVPDTDLCPRYVARLIEGIKIGPSPFEVRLRLARSGVRAISNVVDATNLILLECGQPLHAFDFSLLEEGKIVVRRCDPGETFTTLDGVERKLPENALMIRDGKRSVALAGIMGGLNSEINDNTSTVLIESACFERFGIRRTAKALGMSTEASYRFERGIDPEGTLWAAHRVTHLIQKLAGGTVLSGYLDVYPTQISRPSVPVGVAKTNSLLGTDLDGRSMADYLKRLGIGIENATEESLTAIPPSWRWDLEREVDIAEEVARVFGFQNIPLTLAATQSSADLTRENHRKIQTAKSLMNASGYSEAITMSFVSRQAGTEFAQDSGSELALINPLTEDAVVMRTSLVPGLLSVAKRNINFRWEDLKIYECGKTFTSVPGDELPREDLKLAGLATGSRYPDLWNMPRNETVDFYDVKGALENLLDGLSVRDVQFAPSTVSFMHPGKSADLMLDGCNIGYVGELSPIKAREHGFEAGIYMFEILLEPLFVRMRKERLFTPLPRYPFIERDLSFIVEEKVSGDVIKRLISRLGHDIIASVVLFDLYKGESIPEGYQSMAFRVRYQSEDRTLTDEDVQEVHSRIADALKNEVGAAMRE